MLDENNQDTGLLYNLTGDGKGKTSSALGMVIRALGWNWKVAVLQFMKSDRETGERNFFTTHFPDMVFAECGLGFSYKPGDHSGAAQEGWKYAKQLLQEFDGELLVLDELNIVVSRGYIDAAEVAEALKQRRPGLNVIITGRYSPQELLDVSDLVSEVKMIRHPYENGIQARKGLDY